MQPKIPLPSDDQLPADIRETLANLPPVNVFRMMANAPASFHGFLQLAGSILMQSEFDARKREIAILRVAHLTGSSYEWTQHARLAGQIGVTQEEIDRIGADGPVQGLDEESSPPPF